MTLMIIHSIKYVKPFYIPSTQSMIRKKLHSYQFIASIILHMHSNTFISDGPNHDPRSIDRSNKANLRGSLQIEDFIFKFEMDRERSKIIWYLAIRSTLCQERPKFATFGTIFPNGSKWYTSSCSIELEKILLCKICRYLIGMMPHNFFSNQTLIHIVYVRTYAKNL